MMIDNIKTMSKFHICNGGFVCGQQIGSGCTQTNYCSAPVKTQQIITSDGMVIHNNGPIQGQQIGNGSTQINTFGSGGLSQVQSTTYSDYKHTQINHF